MINLTENEKTLLKSIVFNYGEKRDELDLRIGLEYEEIMNFNQYDLEPRTVQGLAVSLVKKGVVWTEALKNAPTMIGLTEQGWGIVKNW